MNQRENPSISVVVPVYNEVGNVRKLHEELLSVFSGLGESYEILFIDDGSTDGTCDTLRLLSPARVVVFSRNFGKSQALQAGFDEARGEYIITLDGDLQDDPREIPTILQKLKSGFDLVCGWKYERKDPFSKRVVSKIANGMTRIATGVSVHDMNCGLKGFRREAAKALLFQGDMHRYIPAIVSHDGFRVGEVKVHHRPRYSGVSKYGARRIVSGFFDFVTLMFLRKFTDRPMHFFGTLGVALFLAGFGILVYLSWVKLFSGVPINERIPFFFLGILLVVVGFQSFSLGFLGELLIRQNTGDKRNFVIREKISNTN